MSYLYVDLKFFYWCFRMFEHLPTLVKPSRRGIILLDYPGYNIIGDVILFNEDVVPF